MKLIRCTKKVRAMLGLRDAALGQELAGNQPLAEWYCHLAPLGRRNALLFSCSATRFSFLVTDYSLPALAPFDVVFLDGLRANLLAEGVSQAAIERVVGDGQVSIGKTASRSMLASLNELARAAASHAHRLGAASPDALARVNHTLRRAPCPRVVDGVRRSVLPLRELAAELARQG